MESWRQRILREKKAGGQAFAVIKKKNIINLLELSKLANDKSELTAFTFESPFQLQSNKENRSPITFDLPFHCR
ncbi:hypothetical protein EG329_004044 [Mollisiaceae sp. DMI_Dod_QoI]|nr:hypothetical protein EG329_004044 [Helotiales sp. DMI_Dod_QoI]